MVRVLMQAHLWIWWAEIAIDQEKLAREARTEALQETTTNGGGLAHALSRETRASLITVAASAHALDALYGAVADIVPPVRGQTRWSTLLETFKAAFYVRGAAGGGGWAHDFEWLFDLRDAAVHHEEQMLESAPHPTGTAVSAEDIAYSLESATRAVDLLLAVLQTGIDSPRPALTAWAHGSRAPVADLHARRASP
jgi:hypothetical protein